MNTEWLIFMSKFGPQWWRIIGGITWIPEKTKAHVILHTWAAPHLFAHLTGITDFNDNWYVVAIR
jgi:hypothetical protein